jgi:AbrB family looped-hinge helix DNA binding protein
MALTDTLTTTVSTKGQVILPKAVRDNLGWGAGAKLVVEETDGAVTLRRAPLFKPTRPEDVFGMLKSDRPPVSLEEMDEAVAREAKRHARD